MFGPPEDVEGECNAWLGIADDYGDNQATMRCSLPVGHEGDHKEVARRFTVTWAVDESLVCPTHGRTENMLGQCGECEPPPEADPEAIAALLDGVDPI